MYVRIMPELGELATVPAVPQDVLLKRINNYFADANAQYSLPDGDKVRALPQFHIAKTGDPEQDAERVRRLLPKSLHDAVRCAAYGRARPEEIQAITQGLIDARELEAVDRANPALSIPEVIRTLQFKFNMGIDCAGYVQLAFIYAFTEKHDNPKCTLNASKLREGLGLKPRRGWENLAYLPPKHFTEVGFLNGRTGDIFVLKRRASESDWHTMIVVDHTVSGTVHKFLVDASWGFLYGPEAAGVGRRKLMHDTSTGIWWDIHPITGKKEFENLVGPYNKHPIKGMYRAKEEK